MSRADELYRQTCLDILNNGFSDEHLEVRPKWADGTPAHTITGRSGPSCVRSRYGNKHA